MYSRNIYIQRIGPFLGKPVIKVLTGMRRVGKSSFLQQLRRHYESQLRIPASRILFIDKESLAFEDVVTHRDLARRVNDTIAGKSGPKVLLVDEVQEIQQWEKAVVSLAKDPSLDIVLTGSNAHLLSSELATLLSGRYIQFPIYSLSFSEFIQFRHLEKQDAERSFADYLKYGGLPGLHLFPLSEEAAFPYINAIYSTVLLKDVVQRNSVRNVSLLDNIARYLFDNVGNVTSAKRIADYIRSQRLRISVDTVQNYLRFFTDALIAHRVARYDIKGKRLLEIHEKYFLGDIGLRHALLGYRNADVSGLLENVVYLELLRRGYSVHIGKIGDLEVDFIATRETERLYVQVTYHLGSTQTIRRELAPLQAISDNHPKLILSMDTILPEDFDGIRRAHLLDWLKQPSDSG